MVSRVLGVVFHGVFCSSSFTASGVKMMSACCQRYPVEDVFDAAAVCCALPVRDDENYSVKSGRRCGRSKKKKQGVVLFTVIENKSYAKLFSITIDSTQMPHCVLHLSAPKWIKGIQVLLLSIQEGRYFSLEAFRMFIQMEGSSRFPTQLQKKKLTKSPPSQL